VPNQHDLAVFLRDAAETVPDMTPAPLPSLLEPGFPGGEGGIEADQKWVRSALAWPGI
jgi:hypothetical protein